MFRFESYMNEKFKKPHNEIKFSALDMEDLFNSVASDMTEKIPVCKCSGWARAGLVGAETSSVHHPSCDQNTDKKPVKQIIVNDEQLTAVNLTYKTALEEIEGTRPFNNCAEIMKKIAKRALGFGTSGRYVN